MKKLIGLILAMLLVLGLFACGNSTQTGGTPSTPSAPSTPAGCSHSFAEATCTAAKTCTKCGATEGEAVGHNWNAATCTVPKTCATCGATEGDAAGHNWNAATCTAPKTCATCGATEGTVQHNWNTATCTAPKTCSLCGATESAATGHSWNEATCTAPKTCTTCGATEGSATGHNWNAATCTTPKTCATCGATEGSVEHTWNAATCTTPKTCSKCGKTEGSTTAHSWNAATCSAPKTCSKCGKTEGSTAAHSWNAATCSAPKTCSKCGATEGNAAGHSWNAATCSAPKTCSVCGATEGSAGAHSWNAATCTKPKTCATCGATEGTAQHSWGAATGSNPKTCSKCGATEFSMLDQLYAGLTVFHGQLHDHAKTGRNSDGTCTLEQWIQGMPKVGMDYAAILDHKQTDHMYLPQWDPSIFISGTEAMIELTDRPAISNKFHYNMIFPSVKEMEAHLGQFREYVFRDGLFHYSNTMGSARFYQYIQSVKEKGGYFVIPHPLQTDDGVSNNPLDYFFDEWIGYEVFYCPSPNQSVNDKASKDNYGLWTKLLALGKRVYASAGCDEHKMPTNRALTTVYSDKKLDTSYINQLRAGNYTAGPVGIRMAIGDTKMGGQGSFAGNRLIFSVGDFHEAHSNANHTYRVEVITDTGVVFSQKVNPKQTTYFALDVDANAKFYRIEVHDENLSYTRLAVGNPIWNEAFYK